MLLNCNFKVLVLITGSIASVVLSTKLVVRRDNPNADQPPLPDLFTNSRCLPSTCPSRSFCAAGNCCMCQCIYDYPNVLVNTTHLKCTNYGETNRITAANCQYSFRQTNKPLQVIPLTTNSTGKIKFQSVTDRRTNCSENNVLSVKKWQFLDANGHWATGEGGSFNVDFKSVGGQYKNKTHLTFLKWHARVDARYTGLIIKISLKCSGVDIGCILAKISGTFTYLDSPLSTMPPESSPVRPTGVSTVLGTSSSTARPEMTSPKVRTSFEENSKAKQKANAGSQRSVGDAAAIFGPVLGVLGLICIIGLVCVLAAKYRKRKRRSSEKPTKPTDIDSVKLDICYQDSRTKDHTKNDGIDNPIYCDPEEQIIMRRSKLDPLPALPASESIYQTLDESTRNDAGYNLPGSRPPVSYPRDDSQLESSEYLMLDEDSPSGTTDYENPPKYTETYENPLIQGVNSPSVSNQEHESFIETSDYDNQPVQGTNRPPMTSHYRDNLNRNECLGYENPHSTSPSESVPAPTQDTLTAEPEYFELHPETSSF